MKYIQDWLQEAIDKEKVFDVAVKEIEYSFEGKIIDAVILPDNDYLIGFLQDGSGTKGIIYYYLFSEIYIADTTEFNKMNNINFIQE